MGKNTYTSPSTKFMLSGCNALKHRKKRRKTRPNRGSAGGVHVRSSHLWTGIAEVLGQVENAKLWQLLNKTWNMKLMYLPACQNKYEFGTTSATLATYYTIFHSSFWQQRGLIPSNQDSPGTVSQVTSKHVSMTSTSQDRSNSRGFRKNRWDRVFCDASEIAGEWSYPKIWSESLCNGMCGLIVIIFNLKKGCYFIGLLRGGVQGEGFP